jgi:hypothetical protein
LSCNAISEYLGIDLPGSFLEGYGNNSKSDRRVDEMMGVPGEEVFQRAVNQISHHTVHTAHLVAAAHRICMGWDSPQLVSFRIREAGYDCDGDMRGQPLQASR